MEVTVFGTGYGESIVMHVPGIGWGVIDSCIMETDNGSKIVPPLAYLTELQTPPENLSFMILTHPHEDHYMGFDVILKHYTGHISKVCLYAGKGVRELKKYTAKKTIAGANMDNLVKVFKAVDIIKNGGATLRYLSEMTSVFDKRNVLIKDYGSTDISMTALSPNAISIDLYTDKLFKAIPEPGLPVHELDDTLHNVISVALLLKIGELQIILGSDLETGTAVHKNGWIGVLSNRDIPLWANFVKVSHHGSKNGFHEFAWDEHSSKKKPYAFICPFYYGSNRLPDGEEVGTINKYCESLGIVSAVQFDDQLNKHYKRDIIQVFKSCVRNIKVLNKSKTPGLLRIRFDLYGNITETRAVAPAVLL
ncbi:MAG: hypothetical protein HQL05_00470 [Nitrospirae bacterium]|uniref:hypothetical protein n=1 Tax=Candidatus Magnetobacterium casense TaxID=1455061 RepID=UPI0012DD7C2D|nr:hypothetical protein [Candidatus Magnetobacterium casensis]MBF0336280.1 hypothetical protein [Nitrospirota bacterium]